jgi:acyl-CoA synthetase (AMP-forming)/AMP-acid ligase II
MLDDQAEIFTPYGATESLPIAAIGSKEILSQTAQKTREGHGICVGKPLRQIQLKIIKVTDEIIEKWSDNWELATGEKGEIIVKGDVVSQEYYQKPQATAKAKIDDNGEVWHRMGDIGWLDEQGRLWFCGRKNHRVVTPEETMFTITCEAIFQQHPAVYRAALVGIGEKGKQKPVLCIELEADHKRDNKKQIQQELLDLAKKHSHTQKIQTILYHPSFPVDIRHNAKIFREELQTWAAKKVK